MNHSPEPWELHDASHRVTFEDGPTICAMHQDGSCHEIAMLTGCQGMTHEHLLACGERIVACINACKGIPTEKLAGISLSDVISKLIDAAKQLDDMEPGCISMSQEFRDAQELIREEP